ncbi:MAG: hypothetical protein ABI196_00585, partial [Bradyrhizobium sp.]
RPQEVQIPSATKAQHKLMEIAAHTKGGYGGVPQSVGKDFAKADDKAGITQTHDGKPAKGRRRMSVLYDHKRSR